MFQAISHEVYRVGTKYFGKVSLRPCTTFMQILIKIVDGRPGTFLKIGPLDVEWPICNR